MDTLTRRCECGCGETTRVITRSRPYLGHVVGEQLRFITGHHARVMPPHKLEIEWEWRDCGYLTPCQISLYTPKSHGYCMVTIDGTRDYVHRHAYREAYGEIPEGKIIDHRCHSRECGDDAACIHRRCRNPEHLVATTHGDNIRRGHHTVLTVELVAEIRALSGGCAATDREYARRLGVTEHAIYCARTGRSWR